MKKDFKKLKIIFQNDPEMLRSLDSQEQMQKLEEVRLAREMEGIKISKEVFLKGEDGYTPVAGLDYFTPEEATSFKKEITPVKGKDYFDGKDGKNGRDGKDADVAGIEKNISAKLVKLIPTKEEILSQIPKPKDGVNGKDGLNGKDGENPKIEDVVDEIKKGKLLDISDIRNWQSLKSKSKGSDGFDMNDQRWHGGGGASGDGTYTPKGVTTATVGGITSGTDLGTIPVSIQSIFDAMLYPPNIPTTTLTTTPPGGLYENGNVISSVDLASTTTAGSLPITSFIFKKNGATIYTSPTPNPSGGTETYTDGTGVSSNTVYQAIVGDGVHTGSASVSFTYVSAYYYGVAAPGLDISIDGGGLTKLVIENSPTITESFSPTSQVYYFAYPSSYPALTSILDTNGFETIGDWTVSTVAVTNSYGNTVNYRQYEFNNLTTQVNFSNTFIQ